MFEIKDGKLLEYSGNEEYVVIPEGVITIETHAFEGCKNIKTVVIPEGVTSIKSDAFYDCVNLMRVTLPFSLKKIHERAFFGCHKIVEVYDLSLVDMRKVKEIFEAKVVHFSLEEETSIVEDEEGFFFVKTEKGACLFNYIGNLTKLTLPLSFNGECYRIAKYAFYEKQDIISLIIPGTVASIEDYAFYWCYKIVEVYNLSDIEIKKRSRHDGGLGNYVKSIHKSMDEESSIIIKDGYSFVFDGKEYYLFDYEEGKKEHYLPEDINGFRYNILDHAFYYDKEITFVKLSNGVKTVCDMAFNICSKLEKLIISEDVEKIGGSFKYCPKLVEIYNLSKKIQIPDEKYASFMDYCVAYHETLDESHIIKIDGYSFVYDDKDYYLYNYDGEESELELPDNVLGNEYSIFKDCLSENRKITSVIIPDGVKRIGEHAFEFCFNLEEIKLPETLISIGFGAFDYCDKLKNIYIPKNVNYMDDGIFNCENIEKIIVDKENKVYDSRNDCNAIIKTSINKLILGCKNTVIPPEVESIGEGAFAITNVKEIILPKNLKRIGDGAFSSCKKLISIKIPKKIIRISDHCFFNCTSLLEIYIPKSIRDIDFNAFDECKSLTNIYYEGTIDEWDKIETDNGNDVLSKANIYFCSNMDYEEEGYIPKTHKELENFNTKRYGTTGKITHMSIDQFPEQNCMFIKMAIKNNEDLVHVRYFFKGDKEKQNINFNVGDDVFINGFFCYDKKYDTVVLLAKYVQKFEKML